MMRGDLHTHTTWSDGGASVAEMADAAAALGHEYLAVTDHSPRLKIARGLSRERLLAQWEEIGLVQERHDLRILRGIEVDILHDGALDQSEVLLAQLDIVVASIHSGLDDDRDTLTRRMVAAIANPHTTVLGHCTGRKRRPDGTWRRESRFDAEMVFAACELFGVAVEINARPDRADPRRELLELANDIGCLFAINTDAHSPDQLRHLPLGLTRAEEAGIHPDRIITTWPVAELLQHAGRHR